MRLHYSAGSLPRYAFIEKKKRQFQCLCWEFWKWTSPQCLQIQLYMWLVLCIFQRSVLSVHVLYRSRQYAINLCRREDVNWCASVYIRPHPSPFRPTKNEQKRFASFSFFCGTKKWARLEWAYSLQQEQNRRSTPVFTSEESNVCIASSTTVSEWQGFMTSR